MTGGQGQALLLRRPVGVAPAGFYPSPRACGGGRGGGVYPPAAVRRRWSAVISNEGADRESGPGVDNDGLAGPLSGQLGLNDC